MVRLHVFVNRKHGQQPAIHIVEVVPRVGDEIRLDSYTFVKVLRVVWCFDEHTDGHQRANIETAPA